jgi:ABC-2 type transport system ATP-binding protein
VSDAGTTATHAVETSGLTRRFGELIAVDDVSLSIRRGEVFGFLGHNGAGKTTTVRLISGILAPSAGTVRVMGADPQADGVHVRHHVGVLTADPGLDPMLTPREILRFHGQLHGLDPGWAEARIGELIERFGLEETADARSGDLSTGTRQRVALLRALVHDPQVLLLDEPTAATDPMAGRLVRETISTMSREQDRTVVLCTHNLVEAEALCDRLAVIERGRIIALGRVDELATAIGVTPRIRLDIRAEDLTGARAALDGLVDPHDIVTSNGQVEITRGGRDLVPDIVERLVRNGIAVYGISDTTPTLEDVYVALHGRERHDAQHEDEEVASSNAGP